MMSKNSFLVRLIENARRRSWLPVLCMVVLLAMYPLRLLAEISNKLNQYEQIRTKQFYENITRTLKLFGMPSTAMLLVTCVLAVLCGLQGYSYLYHRHKVDMYHSQPVKKSVRFWAIYTNGALFYIVPFLFSILLAMIVMAAQHLLTPDIASVYLIGTLYQIICYLAVYHTTILAVAMTGNYLSFALGIGTFLGLEWGIRTLIFTYCSWFFDTFAGESREAIMSPFFSVGTIYLQGIRQLLSDLGSLSGQIMLEKMGIYVIRVALIGLITLVAAYFAYYFRAEESAGKSVAFSWMKPLVKLVAMIFLALTGGWIISNMAAKNVVLSFVVLILVCVIVHCVLEILYEGHFKAVLSRWWELVIGIAAACMIFSVFQWDLFGYDRYIPKENRVESAGVLFMPQYMEMSGYGSRAYYEDNMFLTDYGMIEELVAADYFHQPNHQSGNLSWQKMMDDEDVAYSQVTVLYRLKNGRKKYRSYYIDMATRADLMQQFLTSEEYKKGVFRVLKEDYFKNNKKLELSLETRMNNNMSVDAEDNEAVINALKKDLEGYDFTTVSAGKEYGLLHIASTDTDEKSNYPRQLESYVIYDSYENLLSCLKERGYERVLGKPTINKVTVERYVDLADATLTEAEGGEPGFYSESYTEPQMISDIIAACDDLTYGGSWKDISQYDTDVTIYANTETGNVIYYSLRKDKDLPKEILQDMHLE